MTSASVGPARKPLPNIGSHAQRHFGQERVAGRNPLLSRKGLPYFQEEGASLDPDAVAAHRRHPDQLWLAQDRIAPVFVLDRHDEISPVHLSPPLNRGLYQTGTMPHLSYRTGSGKLPVTTERFRTYSRASALSPAEPSQPIPSGLCAPTPTPMSASYSSSGERPWPSVGAAIADRLKGGKSRPCLARSHPAQSIPLFPDRRTTTAADRMRTDCCQSPSEFSMGVA